MWNLKDFKYVKRATDADFQQRNKKKVMSVVSVFQTYEQFLSTVA